jgi:hypothetical protein
VLFFVDGGASNWVQFKLGNTFQQLTIRTRPNTHNPIIFLHTGCQKKLLTDCMAGKKRVRKLDRFLGPLVVFP